MYDITSSGINNNNDNENNDNNSNDNSRDTINANIDKTPPPPSHESVKGKKVNTSTNSQFSLSSNIRNSSSYDPDHRLLHGSFSSSCKVGSTKTSLIYGMENERENLMYKFVGSSPAKPSGNTLPTNSNIDGVKGMCMDRYGLVISKNMAESIFHTAERKTTNMETIVDELVENGKFDDELSQSVMCATNGTRSLVQLTIKIEQLVFGNKVRTRLFMKLCGKRFQDEFSIKYTMIKSPGVNSNWDTTRNIN
ncbi:hypothetical protein ACTFIW_005506 [Dictyostelium discoideum]